MIGVEEGEVRTSLGTLPTRLYRSRLSASPSHSGAPAGAPLLLLAPGAGASHRHPFMVTVATHLAELGVSVRTFDFHYAADGRKAPDRMPKLVAAFLAVALDTDANHRPRGALFVGGKSMGSRAACELVCQLAAAGAPPKVSGVVAFGYPLVPKGREHERVPREALLARVPGPVLVVQGARDVFGGADLMPEVVRAIDPGPQRSASGPVRVGPSGGRSASRPDRSAPGAARRNVSGSRVVLTLVDHADHGFEMPKRALAGRTQDDVWRDVASRAASFIHGIACEDGRPATQLSATRPDLV